MGFGPVVVVVRLALVAVAFLLVVPTGSADWLQAQHDASRTGAVDGPTVPWPDIGRRIPIVVDGMTWTPEVMRLVDGDLYFLARDTAIAEDAASGCERRLFRLDLTLYDVVSLACAGRSYDFMSDGNMLLLFAKQFLVIQGSGYTGRDNITALRLNGTEVWHRSVWPGTEDGPPDAMVDDSYRLAGQSMACELDGTALVVLVDGIIYAACGQVCCLGPQQVFLTARQASNGTHLWTIPVDPAARIPSTQGAQANPTDWVLDAAFGEVQAGVDAVPSPTYYISAVSAVGGDIVVAAFMDSNLGGVGHGTGSALVAVDPGGLDGAGPGTVSWSIWNGGNFPPGAFGRFPPPVTGDEDRVVALSMYADVSLILLLNARGGSVASELIGSGAPTFLAYANETAYAGVGDQVFALAVPVNTSAGAPLEEAWIATLPNGWSLSSRGQVVTRDAVFVSAEAVGGKHAVYSINRTTGQFNWGFDGLGEIVASDGYLFTSDGDAIVIVGEMPGSLHARVTVSSDYPAPATVLTVDLTGSKPGEGGAASQVWVDWGDGTVSDWKSGTTTSHIYDVAGAVTARFQVRNPQGQTSTVLHTFYVGAPDPGVTFLEKAFDKEHQNTTFFFLGLLATAAAGLFGVLKVGRRRSRLRREIRDLENDFEATRARPSECEVMLNERRARSQKLALEAKLDEGQAGILLQRVNDLRHRLRIGQMDTRLNFLPHGVVQALQEHLRDGTLSMWERDHLVKVLEEDKILSAQQKTDVRAIIDSWFQRDAGATA